MISENPKSILFAAGGTGGHIFPALAIADECKKNQPNARFVFVGTKEKIESRVVPQHGYQFVTIWISGFHRSLRLENVLFPLKVVTSLIQSFFLIKKISPDIVVGTGGYVCGPVLYVASLLGIPIAVHESNSYPGITTRMLSKHSAKVFTAFDITKRWLKRSDNVMLVGTPTRDSLDSVSKDEGEKYFHLDERKKTVLIIGGSLGASSINRAVKNCIEKILQAGIQLIWQTGKSDAKLIEEMKQKNIGWIGQFIDAIEYGYAAADVVLCRAGATTLAEITRLGKAAILVPYPFAAADHQTVNARVLEEAGAAVMVKDSELAIRLSNELLELLSNTDRRVRMGDLCKSFGKPDAGRIIAATIMELIH